MGEQIVCEGRLCPINENGDVMSNSNFIKFMVCCHNVYVTMLMCIVIVY